MSEDAYSKIKDKILEKAQNEVAELKAEAEKKATEIMNEAEQEKSRIISEARDKAQNEAAVERKRAVATSALKWKMMALEDKEQFIQKTFDLAFEELKKLANSSDYPHILTSLVADAGISLGGGDLIAKVGEADLRLINPTAIAEKITAQTGVKTTLEPAAEATLAYGGAIVQKGSIWVDNSFMAIFERKKRDIRTEVARILFGD
ncbi:MAG: V-type ATP synthase subunit E [Candidatus Heimdallarchaeota archaeon]